MIRKIGNRTYITENVPLSIYQTHEPCLVIHGCSVMKFDHNWHDGHREGIPTYQTCKIEELNGTTWYHTGVNELYKVIATDSKRLQKRFNLPEII